MRKKAFIIKLKEFVKKQHMAEKKDSKDRRKYQGEYGKGWCDAMNHTRRIWLNKIDELDAVSGDNGK